jgi:uracil-DNA glycosylase family 4
MSNIETLIAQIQAEAEREEFPLDIPIYELAKKNPYQPILYFGNLNSNICFFGRDLGRDEVFAGQPLIGAAGKLVRQGFYRAIHNIETEDQQELESIKERLILTNTVPYKPPGNKAYTQKVKQRFRPFVEQLLVKHWQGNQIITLGTEAFKWFENYSDKEEFNRFWSQGDSRYHSSLTLNLTANNTELQTKEKQVTIYPLPHPSPLNQKYYYQFPQMLQNTLSRLAF